MTLFAFTSLFITAASISIKTCFVILSFHSLLSLSDSLTHSRQVAHLLTAPLVISYDVVAYLLGVYDKVEAESTTEKGRVQDETDKGKDGEGLQAMYMKELKVS